MSSPTTVLLCDDSRALRMVSRAMLEDAGFNVIAEAANGIEAVHEYTMHKPDIVLLDLVMPERDGKQALGEILAQDREARVVILSSLGSETDIEDCLRMGARSYLQKPIDPDAMTRVLRDVVA